VRKYATLEVLEAWRQAAPDGTAERRIMKAAHRVAFDYQPRQGYLYVRSRMISSRTNDNHDTFPADEIEKGYHSFLGKPVFVNHHNANHRRARGVIVAVALHRDRNPDGTPDTWVEGLMEVDAVRFPRLAKAILAGRVNRTSMGVDVEWSRCSACGNRATSPAEYCKHLPAMKGKKIRQRNKVTGKVEEKLIHEVCAGLSFFENSLLVEDPADPTAYLLGQPDARGMTKAASADRDQRKDLARRYPLSAYGGTHCLACGEQVKVNMRKQDVNGGWHHHDGMRRDHPALPADPEGVIASIPAANARYDQARSQMRDHMHGLYEQLEGGPVPRRPRGDEDMMPPDPFTASRRLAALPWPSDTGRCVNCGHSFTSPHESSAAGDWQNQGMPFLCNDCAIGHYGTGVSEGKPAPVRYNAPGGTEQHPLEVERGYRDEGTEPSAPAREWSPEDAPMQSQSARRRPQGKPVRGHGRDTRFDGVGLKRDRNGFYVHSRTHRSRSDSYPTADDIPDSDIDEMRTSAAKKAEGGEHEWFKRNPVSSHHIVAAYHEASDDERALGDRWYSDAHHVAKVMGKGDAAMGAGVLSAYSVRTLWPVNLFNASRAFHGDPPGPGTGAMGVHQKAAVRILGGEHHSQVLKAPKTAAFAHLIEHGGDTGEDVRSGKEKVVVDRHAMSVAVGHRLTDTEKDGMPIGQHQHYEHVAHAYRQASKELSAHYGRHIAPHQVQAATWLVQIRKNAAEDASGAKGGGGKGRTQLGENSRTRWQERRRQHHPDIPEENMHYHGAFAEGGDRCVNCGSDFSEIGHAASRTIPMLCQGCLGKIGWKEDSAMPGHWNRAHQRDTISGATSRPLDENLRQSLNALGVQSWQERPDFCTGCGEPMMEPSDLRMGDDQFRPRSSQVPHLCVGCADPQSAPYQRFRPGAEMPGVLRGTRQWGGSDSLPPSQSRRRTAYGETRVPPQVDTLRMDECPVCGEHNVWSGSRCPVCGFVVPPSVFRDPDTSKASEVRDQLDNSGNVEIPPDQPGAGQPDAQAQAEIGSGDDADEQLVHPDQIAPDGVPTVQGEGGPVPAGDTDGLPPDALAEEEEAAAEEDEEAPPGAVPPEDEEDGGQAYAEELICPACGTTFEADAAAQPGVPCPACGMAALHPADEGEEGDEGAVPPEESEDPSAEGGTPEDEEDEGDEDKEMPADRKTAAALAQAQTRRIAELSARNEVLEAKLSFLASAAGVDRELAEIGRQVMLRHADLLNPASPVPDPPQGPPSETTEQALAPEAMDDAGRPGTTPGANSRVPAMQTTTPITPGVEVQTPPATNLVDVTQPVQGTNPSQDGGVPLEQRRIETDVRIDPDPLKAHGPGIGGQGDNGAAFPWLLDARQPGQQGQQPQQRAASASEADASRRTYASIHLARLRVTAGLAQWEDLAVAERIERDASLSTPMIEHEIGVLSAIAPQRQAARPPQQRTAARSVPSLASVGASAQYAPAVMDDLDGADLFL